MIMYHVVFYFLYSPLLGSFHLLLIYHISVQNLKIGSLNINGGRDRQKRALISEVSTQKKINVLFQTHSDPADEVDRGLWWDGSYSLSHGTNISAGVAVLFRPSANASFIFH